MPTLDLSADFVNVVDFQEVVTFQSCTGQGTYANAITINNALKRSPEFGTTGEGKATNLQRLRFATPQDVTIKEAIWLLPESQLGGHVPKRTDIITSAGDVRWAVTFVEENNSPGTYRCLAKRP